MATDLRGAIDNASDFGSEDSRFETWPARLFILRQFKSINKSEGKGIIELSSLNASFFNHLFFFQSCWQ